MEEKKSLIEIIENVTLVEWLSEVKGWTEDTKKEETEEKCWL